MYTWGGGRDGQLGHGDRKRRKVPSLLDPALYSEGKDENPAAVQAIAAGDTHTVLLRAGSVLMFGGGVASPAPVLLPNKQQVHSISAQGARTVVICAGPPYGRPVTVAGAGGGHPFSLDMVALECHIEPGGGTSQFEFQYIACEMPSMFGSAPHQVACGAGHAAVAVGDTLFLWSILKDYPGMSQHGEKFSKPPFHWDSGHFLL